MSGSEDWQIHTQVVWICCFGGGVNIEASRCRKFLFLDPNCMV